MNCSFDGRTSISVCVNCMKSLVSLCSWSVRGYINVGKSHLKQLGEAYRQGIGRHD